jgi:hypothetical protein
MKPVCDARAFAVVLFLGFVFVADAQDSRPRQNEFNKWRYEVSKDDLTDKDIFKAWLLADAPPRGFIRPRSGNSCAAGARSPGPKLGQQLPGPWNR